MEMDAGTLMAMMKDNDGFDFIWILLIFLIFGGNGFGGHKNEGLADIEAAVKAANSTQSEMGNLLSAISGNREAIAGVAATLGADYRAVEAGIQSLSSGLCDLGYKVGMDSRDVLQAICTGNNAIQTQLAECCCQTQRAVEGVNYNLALQGGDIKQAIADCCCSTKAAIKDASFASLQGQCDIRNQMSAGFCDLNNNLTSQITQLGYQQQQGFQGIINHLNAQETDRLRAELSASQAQISQVSQTRALEDFIRNNCGVVCPNTPRV